MAAECGKSGDAKLTTAGWWHNRTHTYERILLITFRAIWKMKFPELDGWSDKSLSCAHAIWQILYQTIQHRLRKSTAVMRISSCKQPTILIFTSVPHAHARVHERNERRWVGNRESIYSSFGKYLGKWNRIAADGKLRFFVNNNNNNRAESYRIPVKARIGNRDVG